MSAADARPVPPWWLIAITDDLRDGAAGLAARASAAVLGGATMIQLRLKWADARTLCSVARVLLDALPRDIPLVIDDRVDVALACGAAGVHVGADDIPVPAIRRLVPPGFLVGTSAGDDTEIANTAQADYVGVGPVYSTQSKRDAGFPIGLAGLTRLARQAACPAVAVGGMTAERAGESIAVGAAGVAAVAGIFGVRDPARAAQAFRTRLDSCRTLPLPTPS